MIKCVNCNLFKFEEEFYRSSEATNGKASWCKDCTKECGKKWNKENKKRKYFTEVKRRYGLSQEEYNNLYNFQRGCCQICKKHQQDLKRTLHIDHNHRTGKVRGLLCEDCNIAIGLFEDNCFNIISAIDYLRSANGRKANL